MVQTKPFVAQIHGEVGILRTQADVIDAEFRG